MVYINICRIRHWHLTSAVLACDRVFKNYLLGMLNGFHSQSGSAKSGVFWCIFFLVSDRFTFIGCKVVASNAKCDMVTGEDCEECE